MFRAAFRAAVLTLLLITGGSAPANVLVQMSYAEKYRAAQLVMVGQVVRELPVSTSPYGRVSEVRVLSTLKGIRQRTIRIYTTDPVVEDDPRCCIAGRTYLMFLHRRAGGIYSSVNGHYAIIPLEAFRD